MRDGRCHGCGTAYASGWTTDARGRAVCADCAPRLIRLTRGAARAGARKPRRSAPSRSRRTRLLPAGGRGRGSNSALARAVAASVGLFLAGLDARGYRPATIATYRKALGRVDGLALARASGAQLLAAWASTAPATRATYLAAVRAFRTWAVEDADAGVRRAVRPLERSARVRVDAPAPRPLGVEAEARVLAAARRASWRTATWIAFMRELGLRPSEPLGLLWGDVELAPGREAVTIRGAKGRRDVTLPIARRGVCGLARLLRRPRNPWGGAVAASSPARAPGAYVLATAWGEPWSYRAALDAWGELRRAAGVKATPHALRHTFATRQLAGGLDGEILRRALRHRSFGMIERYAALDAEGLRRRLRPEG